MGEATTAPGMVMISLSAVALGAAFGGYLPLISLWMETFNISFQKLLFAELLLSALYLAPIMHRKLAARYGYITTINVGLVVAAIMTVAFRFTDNYGFWLCLALCKWTWLRSSLGTHRSLACEHSNREISYPCHGNYATAISIGFAVGPMVIWLFEHFR